MKRFVHRLVRLVRRGPCPGADERYLARSADHQDLEIRLRALERQGRSAFNHLDQSGR